MPFGTDPTLSATCRAPGVGFPFKWVFYRGGCYAGFACLLTRLAKGKDMSKKPLWYVHILDVNKEIEMRLECTTLQGGLACMEQFIVCLLRAANPQRGLCLAGETHTYFIAASPHKTFAVLASVCTHQHNFDEFRTRMVGGLSDLPGVPCSFSDDELEDMVKTFTADLDYQLNALVEASGN